MNKTKEVAEAIYKETLFLLKHYNEILIKEKTKDVTFSYIRKLYSNMTNSEKEVFFNFIKIIITDSISTILSTFDFEGGEIISICDELKIICNNQELDPWINDFYQELLEDNLFYTKKVKELI